MTADRPYLTVPELATDLGIDQNKVLAWIRAGELLAIDISERRGGRPRWRIPRESWDAFRTVRSNQASTPAVSPTRRRPAKQVGRHQWY